MCCRDGRVNTQEACTRARTRSGEAAGTSRCPSCDWQLALASVHLQGPFDTWPDGDVALQHVSGRHVRSYAGGLSTSHADDKPLCYLRLAGSVFPRPHLLAVVWICGRSHWRCLVRCRSSEAAPGPSACATCHRQVAVSTRRLRYGPVARRKGDARRNSSFLKQRRIRLNALPAIRS